MPRAAAQGPRKFIHRKVAQPGFRRSVDELPESLLGLHALGRRHGVKVEFRAENLRPELEQPAANRKTRCTAVMAKTREPLRKRVLRRHEARGHPALGGGPQGLSFGAGKESSQELGFDAEKPED